MIPYYVPYAEFARRRFLEIKDKPANYVSEAERANFLSCFNVYANLNENEKRILISCYKSEYITTKIVKRIATDNSTEVNLVYKILHKANREFAKTRGLI